MSEEKTGFMVDLYKIPSHTVEDPNPHNRKQHFFKWLFRNLFPLEHTEYEAKRYKVVDHNTIKAYYPEDVLIVNGVRYIKTSEDYLSSCNDGWGSFSPLYITSNTFKNIVKYKYNMSRAKSNGRKK